LTAAAEVAAVRAAVRAARWSDPAAAGLEPADEDMTGIEATK